MDKLEIDIDPLILMPSIIGPKVKSVPLVPI